jgi:hypothetical protein
LRSTASKTCLFEGTPQPRDGALTPDLLRAGNGLELKRADAERYPHPSMKAKTLAARGLEILALAMIGEGVVGLLRPRRYSLFWKIGPHWLRETAETLAEHREATRLICLGEIALGLWIALREIED